MKVTAIIAEYNPFHNGHAAQIQTVRKTCGADACVIIMSGNFVQRGTPAIVDKFTRTRWALLSGADIVFELPSRFATAGAEQFAYGACALLHRLGFIDSLCFGSETDDIRLLETIADFLLDPPDSFHRKIQTLVRQGKSFAAAREEALYPLLVKELSGTPFSGRTVFHDMLSAPNTILGIEYCKALKKLHSTIQPFPIRRLGSSYHAAQLPEETHVFSSASAIRAQLLSFQNPSESSPEHVLKNPSGNSPEYIWKSPSGNFSKSTERIAPFVPEYVFSDLQTATLLDENDFSSVLYYALLGKHARDLTPYYEVSEEIAQKICREFPYFTDVSSFTKRLKTKQYAHARLQRALVHILLSIQKDEPFQEGNYLRLLGLKKGASRLLRNVPEQNGLHIITKPADAENILSEHDANLYKKEVYASQLYGFTACRKPDSAPRSRCKPDTEQPDASPEQTSAGIYRELATSPVIV